MFKKIIKKIENRIKNNYYVYTLVAICLVALILYFPSLANFYTNDDFFHLRISQVNSFKEFLNFFNLFKSPEGWGLYRPLTTQVFYFLTVKFFNLSPLPLHIISFLTFFVIVFLVSEFTRIIIKNKNIALLSAFLYATSATHFGHLYFLGAYQELGMTLFFLSSVIFFVKYEINTKTKYAVKYLFLSFIFFIMALMSKETALVLPPILVLTYIYFKLIKRINISIKTFIFSILPYILTLLIYLFLRFRYYGFVSGDSYLWNFSPFKAINTLSWYGLWAFNIPEMLVDFVGPGLHLNPNLLKYWSKEIIPIFTLFVLQIFLVFGLMIKSFINRKKISKEKCFLLIFSFFWFVLTLIPIIFLSIHKFTFYLTLPLIGIVLVLGYLLKEAMINRVGIGLFLAVWIITSVLTLRFTIQTNWITQGEKVSEKVYLYFLKNRWDFISKNIIFIDISEDKSLPWSPTETIKTVLSGNNFFYVFYPEFSVHVYYSIGATVSGKENINIRSRQFLGY